MSKLNICVVGGDLRFKSVGTAFKKDGHEVCLCGFDGQIFIDCIDCCKNAQVVVLPLPVTLDDININAPFSEEPIDIKMLFDILPKDTYVVGGKISPKVFQIAASKGIHIEDYLLRSELAVFNAIPTAEGAIEVAMNELATTIWKSKILVCGYGRIGKLLSMRLFDLGADISVMARKDEDLTWIKLHGYTPVKISDLHKVVGEYDVIYNTVPATIITHDILKKCRDDVLIIDLASKPGGVDMQAATDLSRKVIWSLSLPGKVAPITAGIFIKDTIEIMLNERGVPNA